MKVVFKNTKRALLLFSIFFLVIILIAPSKRSIINEKEICKSKIGIRTEKLEYLKSEPIKITITNNLKEDIFSHIGSGTPIFAIKYIERKIQNKIWKKFYAMCQYPNCIYDSDAPQIIEPSQSKSFYWNPLLFIDGTSNSITADSGLYRIQILYMDFERKNWKTEYSNNFIIK